MDRPKYLHCSYKNKHKYKLHGNKIRSNRFTIAMNSCNTNAITNPDIRNDADLDYYENRNYSKHDSFEDHEDYDNLENLKGCQDKRKSHKASKNHKKPKNYEEHENCYEERETCADHEIYYEDHEHCYEERDNYERKGRYEDYDNHASEDRKTNYHCGNYDRFCLSQKSQPEIICNDPAKYRHCIPRRGELIINGSFEKIPNPFYGWVINSGVKEIDLRQEDIAHQGQNAAILGAPNPYAHLYQDVPGICPDSFYQLNFFLSAASKYGNSCVHVRMEFLDHGKNLLDCPVLEILIPENSLSNEVYTFFNNATHVGSPPEARFARIHFEINTREYPERYVHLDDVSLIEI